jgi:thiamine kinase-like enzyme
LTDNQYFDKKINMKYKDKTKEQRINELAELHQRIEDLEAEATKRKKAEESLREALKEVKQLKKQLREEKFLPSGRN